MKMINTFFIVSLLIGGTMHAGPMTGYIVYWATKAFGYGVIGATVASTAVAAPVATPVAVQGSTVAVVVVEAAAVSAAATATAIPFLP